MPIDQKGTEPGLVNAPKEPKPVNLRCRNSGCDSMTAIEVTPPGTPGHRYQCTRCKNTWGINTGGSLDLP